MPLTKSQKQIRGRIGAFAQHARHDPRETTSAARQAFLERFSREVDPHNLLPERERARRALAARRAYFQRLAFVSAKARTGEREVLDEQQLDEHLRAREAAGVPITDDP